MRVKLDEDLSPGLGEVLARYGHTALTIVGQGWGGLKDSQLWPRVVAEKVFFITGDKGFGDPRCTLPVHMRASWCFDRSGRFPVSSGRSCRWG